jgi:hypothetical protein
MKRTDALKIINDEYSKYVNDWIELDISNQESFQNFIRLEERILTSLEKAGMLPPFTYLKKIGTLDTAWEPED